MNKFKIITDKTPKGDQNKAIKEMIDNLKKDKTSVLFGGTGTGKTFSIANVIESREKPTLVLAHNKTLASQLYVELQELFPNNAVEYYISYFDFYQPEAYNPQRDVYFEKQTVHNWEIEMMRFSTIDSLLKRKDVIVVATVAAIYGARDPREYVKFVETLKVGQEINRRILLRRLVELGYKRNDMNQEPGTFSSKGDSITIAPSWTDKFWYRIEMFGDEIENISEIDTITRTTKRPLKLLRISPAQQSLVSKEMANQAILNQESLLI